MTNEELIAKFNPANAATLTAEDLQIMRTLTDEQIGVLADAYPNQPMRRAYLRLYDNRLAENKQIFPTSTWQNLRNARKFSNLKYLLPYDFIVLKSGGKPAQLVNMNQKGNNKTTPVKKVVDLSATDAAKELTQAIQTKSVDNATKVVNKPAAKKAAKPAPPVKKATKAAAQEVVTPNVENESQPDDQTFTAGE